MIRQRVSLAHLMAMVAVLAAGLAAIKVATLAAAQLSWTLFLVALMVGTLGLIVRRDRAAWIGFTLFGWAYALVAFVPPIRTAVEPSLPGYDLIHGLVIDRIHPLLPKLSNPLPFSVERKGDRYFRTDPSVFGLVEFQPTPQEAQVADALKGWDDHREAREQARQILLAFAGMTFALVGAVAGFALSDPSPAPGALPEARPLDSSG